MHGLLFALGLGAAAPSPVELTWTGDASCSQAHFQASLAAYLASVTVAAPLRAEVRTHRRGRGWTLTLTLGGRSVRKLRGPSCASISEAAAFITAVTVDPTVSEQARPTGAAGHAPAPAASDPAAPPPAPPDGPSSPATSPPPELPAAPPLPSATVPPAPTGTSASAESGGAVPAASVMPGRGPGGPGADALDTAELLPRRVPVAGEAGGPGPRRAGPGGFIRVAGGLEAVGLPAVGGQVQVAAGPFGRAWRVELRGLYRAPSRAFAPENPTVGGRIGLWTVGAQGCGVLRPSVLEIPLCAGVEAGRAHGIGFGFSGAQRTNIPWVGVTVGAALAWAPRRWLALWLGVELVVPVLRGSFDIAGLGDVHRIGPVSPRAALGIELRFR